MPPEIEPQEPLAAATGTEIQHPMLFVQAIKGAPASVLLALAITGRFMSHKELQLWTRCGKNQVSFALQSLTQLGWAVGRTTRGPWALARPLATPAADLFDAAIPFKGLGSSSDSLKSTDEDEVLQPSPPRRELLECLYAAGIREPTASELADLPHVNVDYARAHMQAAQANGLRVGAAIQAMRLGAPPPAVPTAKTAEARQAEVEDKIQRFREGR